MKRLTTKTFIEKAIETHGLKYDYSLVNYDRSHIKIKIICPEHGIFEQKPNGHLNGWGCNKCARKYVASLQRRSLDDFVKKCREVHGDLYDYSNVIYVNDGTAVEIICKIHGSFFMIPSNHIFNKNKCQSCSRSKSNKCTYWLDSLNVPHDQREKTIKFNDGTWIMVDAYDDINNTIYEFWGDYWHGNPKAYHKDYINHHLKTTMNELYQKTKKKIARIKKHGYNLIEMWEFDYNNLNNLPNYHVKRKV